MNLVYFIFLILITTACTTTSTTLNGAQLLDAGSELKPTIQNEWQMTFLNQFKKDRKAKSAVGLFSSGGWSNSGQLMVVDEGGASLRVLFAAPGVVASEIDRLQTHSIPRNEVDFNYISNAMSLPRIDEVSFDNLTWEVVVLQRKSTILGETIKASSLFINTTNREKYPSHDKLLNILQNLVPKQTGGLR